MVNINFDNLTAIIDSYKQYFADHYSDEICKWKAVRHFQLHWDIEADDFKGMLVQALGKTGNLLISMNNFPKKMLESYDYNISINSTPSGRSFVSIETE